MFEILFEIHERKKSIDETHEHEKNVEKDGIKTTVKETPLPNNISMEKSTMSKKSSNLLAKANFHSKNALGSIGRPVAVGTGIGFGSYYAGNKWDIEFLQDGYNCAVVGIVGAAGVELGLATFGDDTDLRTTQALTDLKEAVKEDTKGTLPERLLAAGASEADIKALSLAGALLVSEPGNEENQGKKTKSA